MDHVTFEDFVMWKAHPVTKNIFHQLQLRLDSNKEYLASSAGDDPKNDLIIRGYSQAITDLLTIEYGDTQND